MNRQQTAHRQGSQIGRKIQTDVNLSVKPEQPKVENLEMWKARHAGQISGGDQ